MVRSIMYAVAGCLSLPALCLAQTRHFPLESTTGVRLHNVVGQAGTLQGKKGLRLSPVPEAEVLTELLAPIEGVEFSSGVIEAEIAGTPGPGAGEGARGFVGIAFRLQGDMKTYDAFYLRPTNGRVEDQERRNHATQYISHPDWTWNRLRQETSSKYESYVDVVPNTWTKVRIEVRGDKAKLFVHDAKQPVLVVNDVKSGASKKGAIALWIGPGTIGHFRNLRVTPAAP